jgi:hypothetical protein
MCLDHGSRDHPRGILDDSQYDSVLVAIVFVTENTFTSSLKCAAASKPVKALMAVFCPIMSDNAMVDQPP